MNRIPCKMCPQCGLFNDFTIGECKCGKKLNHIEAQLIDTDLISPERCGEIDASLKVFVQKCSACGALNYTDNPSNPIKVCYNCHKTRIASIIPVEYVAEGNEKQEVSSPEVEESSSGICFSAQQVINQAAQNQPSSTADSDDDDDDDDFAQWQGILENIQKTVGTAPKALQVKPSQQNTRQAEEQKATQILSDDNDDDDAGDWSDILGITPKQQTASAPVKKDITLTAIRYGRLSFTIEAGQETYMLGRSANQGSFLSQDGRVGNEHCYLFYRNGAWFVRDNNSKNGTAINSRDIGQNGECMLSDGDELKLGHHPNSMAFRISIS